MRLNTQKLIRTHILSQPSLYRLYSHFIYGLTFLVWFGLVISLNEALHLPDELRLLVLLSSCYFFCLIKDQEQTYRADRPPLPNGAHLGCPGKSWLPQLPHLLLI